MGRGSLYPHRHFVLIDDSCFERGDLSTLKSRAFGYFRAFPIDTEWDSGEAYLFADADKFWIGIDTGGGYPCMYVKPKTYIHNSGEEKEYTCNKEARHGFNRLISVYGELLRFPTSSYTSSSYGKQKDGTINSYGRWA